MRCTLWTARSKPYRQVFGRGRVHRCTCNGPCRVDPRVRRGLEEGGFPAVARLAHRFPCEPGDARFDPERSLRAGHVFIERLDRAYGGNLPLMYIGYNSGPGVATAIWKKIGKNPSASLAMIAPHLVPALRPHFGGASAARARALLRLHLPKLRRAFERFRRDGGATGA